MKLVEFSIETLDVEAIAASLKENGIKPNKLEEATSAVTLAPMGKFTKFDVATTAINGEDQSFVRIHTDKGDIIPLSRLQINGAKEKPTAFDVKFSEKAGKYYPSFAQEVINPRLSGNQASVLKQIIGKTFTAKEVTVWQPGFDENEANAVPTPKKAWIVEVK